MKKFLIVSANPWSFCAAVERDFARENAAAEVDAMNLFTLVSRGSPHWRRRDKLIETLNRKIDRFVMTAINGRDITSSIRIDRGNIPPLPETYEELRDYRIGTARVGLATLSSATSLTTIQFPLSLAEFGPVLAPAWRSAHLSLRVAEAVRPMGYDQILIFNGRHCYSRPFCDLLEQHSDVVRYEQGSRGNKYVKASGAIQDPTIYTQLVEAHPYDPAAGDTFYRERIAKDPANEVSLMTAPQRKRSLPDGLKAGECVVFFTSSSDEMFAVFDEISYGEFPDQHALAMALSKECRELGLQLVVRLHPHLRFKHPSWLREWNFDALRSEGAMVLGPEDPSDSYALVEAARAVITTGSTIGLEASYLGVPNAVLGKQIGGCLGASVVAHSASDLARFLADPRLLPEARERALLFGSFYKCAGKLLPALDVGTHTNFARIDGRIVDPIRFAIQTLRFALRPPGGDPNALDIKSGLQGGKVVLAPGTDYSSFLKRRS